MEKIKVGSDFSGVGAFNQALIRLGINYHEVFACDIDRYARRTFIHNYGIPDYFPSNVYDREIPKQSLDIYMTSPPCQAFSLAGKRLGKEDKRGILFFNSHEFIQVNKPRFFIFENVKGLLSHDGGKTFSEWINLLGGKSVNGNPVLFPYDDSVPYHIYWKVLNATDFNVPQNRERVFIVGIRDDKDNLFTWPKDEPLQKRLKNILETNVDKKYFLSQPAIKRLLRRDYSSAKINPDIAGTINTKNNSGQCSFDGGTTLIGAINNNGSIEQKDISNCIDSNFHKGIDNHGQRTFVIQIKSATSSGYELATDGDSINLSQPNSTTRRGRVGKQVAQTLETSCNQAVINKFNIRRLTPRECFRLMDFPDSFTWPVSDSQAYKQAGNSIVVACLEVIIKNLKTLIPCKQ